LAGWFGQNSPQHCVNVIVNPTGGYDELYCWEKTSDFVRLRAEHRKHEVQRQSVEMRNVYIPLLIPEEPDFVSGRIANKLGITRDAIASNTIESFATHCDDMYAQIIAGEPFDSRLSDEDVASMERIHQALVSFAINPELKDDQHARKVVLRI